MNAIKAALFDLLADRAKQISLPIVRAVEACKFALAPFESQLNKAERIVIGMLKEFNKAFGAVVILVDVDQS